MVILLGWVILAVLIAVWANRRGRNAVIWFFVAVLLSPLLAWLALLAFGKTATARP